MPLHAVFGTLLLETLNKSRHYCRARASPCHLSKKLSAYPACIASARYPFPNVRIGVGSSMAMAISGRAAALVVPSTAATTPLPSTVFVNQSAARLRMKATMKVATAPHASGGGGGAVLERPPAFDQSQLDMLPVTQEGVDPGRLRDGRRSGSGDSCKVLLVDDVRHTEKHVEKALPQVVPSITAEAARQLFHESRLRGVATVIVAVKEHAEFYAQMMVRQGLRSAIEPESDMAT